MCVVGTRRSASSSPVGAPRRRRTCPPRGDHAAPERRRQRGDRAADRAQAHDPDGHVAHLARLQRLPRPLALELEQLRQPAETARIIIITYSAIGAAKTPRALVIDEAARERLPASARARRPPSPSGPSAGGGSGPGAGRRCRPAAARGASPRRRRAAPSASPSSRDRHEPRAGRRAADALQVARRGSAPRGWASGRSPRARRPGRAPGPDRAGSAGRLSTSAAVGRHRGSRRAPTRHHPAQPRGGVRRSRRPWAASRGPPTAGRSAAAPPRAPMAATNRSPARYCSIFRSMPVSRSMAARPRAAPARRAWKRSPRSCHVRARVPADLVHH